MFVDLHCDTIKKAKDENLKLDSNKLLFNTKDVKLPHIQCLAVFVHSKYNENTNGFKRANEIIDNFYKTYNPEEMYIIQNKNDIESPKLNKKIGAILTIENGTAISGNLDNIEKLYNKAIRMMGIVWNEDNDLGCGALTQNDKGLTSLGIQYVKELENRKIIIDVSHASEKTFWDTARNVSVPIVASHSCVKKLCNHPRNLSDEQIKHIAKTNGVIGICFCNSFLTKKQTANVEDIVNHIDYIANLVGIDYISFGSDFDGLEKENILDDVKGVKDLELITKSLEDKGYTTEDIDKITAQNFLRVVKSVL